MRRTRTSAQHRTTTTTIVFAIISFLLSLGTTNASQFVIDWDTALWYDRDCSTTWNSYLDYERLVHDLEVTFDGKKYYNYKNQAIVGVAASTSSNNIHTVWVKTRDLNTGNEKTYTHGKNAADMQNKDDYEKDIVLSRPRVAVGFGLSTQKQSISQMALWYKNLGSTELSKDYNRVGSASSDLENEVACNLGEDYVMVGFGARASDEKVKNLVVQYAKVVHVTQAPTPVPGAPTSEPTPAPTPEVTMTCTDATEGVLQAVDDYYNEDTATITTHQMQDGSEVEIVDFADKDHNGLYKKYCEDDSVTGGGKYVELSYEATCENLDSGESVKLYVSRQPRCYASPQCNSNDGSSDQELFERYTLSLTEARNGPGWSCTGTLMDKVSTGCEFEADMLNNSDEIYLANQAVAATVETQRWLFIFTMEDLKVTFPDFVSSEVKELERLCTEQGGDLHSLEYSTFECGTNSGDEASSSVEKYQVYSMPACLGASCDAGLSGFDSAMTSVFREKMGGSSSNCYMTSGAFSTTSFSMFTMMGMTLAFSLLSLLQIL